MEVLRSFLALIDNSGFNLPEAIDLHIADWNIQGPVEFHEGEFLFQAAPRPSGHGMIGWFLARNGNFYAAGRSRGSFSTRSGHSGSGSS